MLEKFFFLYIYFWRPRKPDFRTGDDRSEGKQKMQPDVPIRGRS